MNLIKQSAIPECSEFVGVKIGVNDCGQNAVLRHDSISRHTDGYFVVDVGVSRRWWTVGELIEKYDYFLFVESK
jgi:hypothetical protein